MGRGRKREGSRRKEEMGRKRKGRKTVYGLCSSGRELVNRWVNE